MKKDSSNSILNHIEKALLIRQVESSLLDLFSVGKLFGTVHTCIGQEWTGIAISDALVEGDQIFSNHRCHGHYIARTDDVEGLIAEIMGKETGMCGGRGGSQHICSKGFFSNGIQGGIVPVAAGMAMSHKLKATDNIMVVFIGDGTLGEGIVYETLNIASKWELPLLIVLENNFYAQSTSSHENLAGDICSRARAFGIDSYESSTAEPHVLMSAAKSCVDQVRELKKPVFLKIDTYRLMAHSKGDDFRDLDEVASQWDTDYLATFSRLNENDSHEIESRNKKRIEDAIAEAEASPYAQAGKDIIEETKSDIIWSDSDFHSNERLGELITKSIHKNMSLDESIVVMGEDIKSPYGGAFKVTKGLSEDFPDRVFNTPISEGAIAGLGNGLAINGMRPVCEIMFGDFLTLMTDQWVNHTSKIKYMYNDQVSIPLIVRTPMGGKRGYGPTHSQSIEKHFLGLPDTQVLALNSRYSPELVYNVLFENRNSLPTLVIENKLLYTVRPNKPVPDGFVLMQSDELYPTIRLIPESAPDLTILCYGGLLPDVEQAIEELFSEHEILCDVICPVQLYPFNNQPVIESVSKSGNLLIVEEGHSFAAFGSEVVAGIVENKPGMIKRLKRLSSLDHPIPCSGPLEEQTLPNTKSIISSALELFDE